MSVPFGASKVTKRMERHVSKLLVLKGSTLEVTTFAKSPKNNHEQHHDQNPTEPLKSGQPRPNPKATVRALSCAAKEVAKATKAPLLIAAK